MRVVDLLTAAISALGLFGKRPSGSVHVPPSNALLDDELINFIDGVRVRWDIQGVGLSIVASPSFHIGLVEGGEWTSEVHTFGKAALRGNDVTPDTYFGIASNSKLFSAVALGLLIENGTMLPNGDALGWKSKAKDVFPRWGLQDKAAEELVDMTDLLSMQSGLPRHDYARASSSDEALDNLAVLPPSYEFRQVWQYNNHHYNILPLLYPYLANVSYPEYVQKHIFDPLGLSASFNSTAVGETGMRSEGHYGTGRNFTACRAWDESAAKGEVPQACKGAVHSLGWWMDGDGLYEAGAGGVMLTPNDMAKWVQELLDPKVLPVHLLQRLTTPVAVASSLKLPHPEASTSLYALAQQVYTYRGHLVHEHGGSVPGQMSRLIRLPERGFGLMVAVNDQDFGSALHGVIAYTVLDRLLGLPPVDWEDRLFRPVATEVESYPPFRLPRGDPEGKGVAVTWASPAYPTFTLKRVDLHPLNVKRAVQAAIQQHATGHPYYLDSLLWVGEYASPWATHFAVLQWRDSVYNWTLFDVPGWRHGGGQAYVVDYGSCVINKEGMGMFGNWWGKGGGESKLEAQGNHSKELAEVWFERVGA